MEPVHFGTDGWRGIIAEDFTFENVRRVGKALARLLREKGIEEKPVVVGYDYRFMSEYFARAVSDELRNARIPVQLSDRPIPTPALSLAAKKKKASCGVMITASHNPHFYNGIKFKAAYGGPVMPDFTTSLSRLLGKVKKASNLSTVYEKKTPVKNLLSPYLATLGRYVDFSGLRRSSLKLAVDSMHATGGDLFKQLLTDTDIRVVSMRTDRNPLFDMDLPEPAPPLLDPLSDLVRREKCDLGLATDGDADRIGVVDHKGRFVTLHYIMPLLYEYLAKSRGFRGDAVRTTSTDKLLDDVCFSYGARSFEVPVGFTHVCRKVLEEDILVGGEESGGICFRKHIPERDGILSGLLILEMMSSSGKSLADLVRDIGRRFHPVCYRRLDRVFDQKKLKQNMKSLRVRPPGKIAGSPVDRVDHRDGIKFFLKNGCWMLMRVSDTEPKGRIYTGGPALELVKRTLRAGERLLFR